jgi:hypothetical protein
MHGPSRPAPPLGPLCRTVRTREGNFQVAKVDVSDEERQTIRDERRELARMVEALQGGDLAKLVLTQRNPMRAAAASAETLSAIQRARARAGDEPSAP